MSHPTKHLSEQKQSQLLALIVAAAGLAIFFYLALGAAIAKAPTADEGMHLLRSQVLRQTDELQLQGQHTPLSHWIIGTFLLSESSIPDVESLPSWPILSPEKLVQEFLWQSGLDVERLLLLGRMATILVGLSIGAMLAHWARLRTGLLGESIAVALFAFSPNLLASAALTTTDIVATAAFLAAILAFWHYWRHPARGYWLLAAITLGLAISSKMTGLLVLPITLLLSYLPKRAKPWWRPGLVWLSMLPVAMIVVWAVYGFELGRVATFPYPIPAATFVSNFVEVQKHIERGHYAFLLGERSNQGWWHYFAIAYLVKTPAVTLLLLLVAVIYLTLNRRWRQTIYLWLPAVALFAAASISRLNIGYRHILPIVPFIWLLIAESAPFWQQRRSRLLILAIAFLIYGWGTIRQRPHFLAYFNEFVGGSSQGYRYLGDSNIDWGQDLNLLAAYAREISGQPLYVSYFGPNDPAYYGLDAPALFDAEGHPIGFSPANPTPGRYAISVNHLQGASEDEPDLFDWFRRQDPVGQLGYSILIFDVPERHDGAWIGQCLDPVPFLDEAAGTQIVGKETVRHIFFDCRTSWVFPADSEPGWYIMPPDLDLAQISPHIANELALVYANRNSRRTPDYFVYHWSGTDEIIDKILNESGPITSTDGRTLEPPLMIPGLAQLLGGLANGTTWGSIWQSETLTEAPLSVLMHLYGAESGPFVADGLGFQGIQWQPGDVFIQYHDFAGIDGQYLETGLYDFSSGDRLPIAEAGTEIRIYRLLAPQDP